jgi:arylsulfatase A
MPGSLLALGAVILVLFSGAVHSQTTVLVEENFGGTGGPLNGTSADIFATAITGAGGSATWSAATGFSDNGAVSVSRLSAHLNLGSYINDAKGTANGKFDLTMTISETTGAWISLGFSTLNTPATTVDFTAASGLGTIVYRDAINELDMWIGPGTGGAQDGPDNNTGPRTLTVSLDLTPDGGYNGVSNFGTVTWTDSGLGAVNNLGTAFALPNQSIGAILVSGALNTTGTVSALTLSQISGGPDIKSPTLVSTDPADGADNIPTSANLVAEFNEPVRAGTGDIILRESIGAVEVERFEVESSSRLKFGERNVSIDPTNNLEPGIGYEVVIESSAIEDLAGNPFQGITTPGAWSFTTDATAPGNLGTTPIAAMSGVSPDANLTLTFDEPVRIGTGKLEIRRASDGSIVETIDVAAPGAVLVNGTTVTIKRSVALGPGTAYYVTLDAGAFEDLSGNGFAGISDSATWTFQTLPPLRLRIGLKDELLDFEWDARSGRRYDLLSSTDLATPPTTWPPYDDGTMVYRDMTPEAPSGPHALSRVSPQGSQRFFTLVEKSSPNIVVILADDLGIECLSTYGGVSHNTPNLDRLASQGKRFTHCFSNPYCSPSRASLLTGRYPFLNGLKTVLFDQQTQANLYLRPTQPSFARQFKQAGYATAIAGKWQLSFLTQNNTINEFGFDEYQCWQIFDANGNKTRRDYQPHFNRNGVIRDDIADRYGPDVNVEFLTDFITRNVAVNRPFLAYYTCMLPHFPWVPTPDSVDQSYILPNAESAGDPRYFPDMVAYMDKLVGRLMQTLEDQGIAENTILVFMADNGTDRSISNLYQNGVTIQGGKGTMTDRGTRVPLIVRWPGRIAAGSICDDLIDFSDFFPTLCELANVPLPTEALHGQSFVPQLLGDPGDPREWVHVQDQNQRHIRDKNYILTNSDQLRPVVEIWQPKAANISPPYSTGEAAARDFLQSVFDTLGN